MIVYMHSLDNMLEFSDIINIAMSQNYVPNFKILSRIWLMELRYK